MNARTLLYRRIAEAVRAHGGGPALAIAICDVVAEEIEAEIRDRVDDLLHRPVELT